MKKIISILTILFSALALFSCKNVEGSDAKLDIQYNSTDKAFSISIPYIEDASYINVYRKDSTGDIFNIAQIIPSTQKYSFLLIDSLLVDETYQYTARYKIFNEYKNIDWSDERDVTGSSYSDDPAPQVASGTWFAYDEQNSNLSLGAGSIDFPADNSLDDYNLCLIVSNGKDRTVFNLKLADGTGITTSTAPFGLTSLFTMGYINRPITIEGVVCQKIEKTYAVDGDSDTPLRYTTVKWSAPSDPITIKVDGTEVDSIKVLVDENDNGNYDYSSRSLLHY